VDRFFLVPLQSTGAAFFRLRGVEGLRILQTRVEGASIRIDYE
jgi:hypothetical protein